MTLLKWHYQWLHDEKYKIHLYRSLPIYNDFLRTPEMWKRSTAILRVEGDKTVFHTTANLQVSVWAPEHNIKKLHTYYVRQNHCLPFFRNSKRNSNSLTHLQGSLSAKHTKEVVMSVPSFTRNAEEFKLKICHFWWQHPFFFFAFSSLHFLNKDIMNSAW